MNSFSQGCSIGEEPSLLIITFQAVALEHLLFNLLDISPVFQNVAQGGLQIRKINTDNNMQ